MAKLRFFTLSAGGELLLDQPLPPNKGLIYGDHSFTSFTWREKGVISLDLHWQRLCGTFEYLTGREGSDFKSKGRIFLRAVHLLLQKENPHSILGRVGWVLDLKDDIQFYLVLRPHLISSNPLKVSLYAAEAGHIFESKVKGSYFTQRFVAKEQKKSWDDIIFVSNDELLDASTSGILVKSRGIYFFSQLRGGVLESITRLEAQKYFKGEQIPYREKSITTEDLESAEALYLLNGSAGARAVAKVKLLNDRELELNPDFDFVKAFNEFRENQRTRIDEFFQFN